MCSPIGVRKEDSRCFEFGLSKGSSLESGTGSLASSTRLISVVSLPITRKVEWSLQILPAFDLVKEPYHQRSVQTWNV
jgi:hypothetical protein